MTLPKKYFPVGLFLLFLIICDLTFFKTHGFLHFGLLLATYAGLYFIYKNSKLEPGEIGLSRKYLIDGLKLGAAISVIILVALLIVFMVDSNAFRDPRYQESIMRALLAVLFVEPIKVILFEELAFRGILVALLKKISLSTRSAVLLSSLCFGLWHVTSSAAIGSYSVTSGFAVQKFYVMLTAIIFTAAAGIILCILRLRSKSLAAPFIVHWSVNPMAIILAALSWM